MQLAKPYANLIDILTLEDGIKLLKKIEWCGRISHRSEDTQTATSYDRFIRTVVLEHGDWSIVEHAGATVDILVDRGITHELVRHRLFSFTQESTRFVNYEKKMPPSFIQPDLIGRINCDVNIAIWDTLINQCEIAYSQLIQNGIKPQIARSVFPNALSSRIIITGNLRNWRHFFIMRTTLEAHPQMREISIPLLKEFQEKIPIIYDDIEPMTKQSIAMSKIR